MTSFTVRTTRRTESVDITARVGACAAAAGWRDGVLHVFCPHTTAGVTINESADPDVRRDLLATFDRLVPRDGDYRHAEGNSDAHVKASLVGAGAWVPLAGGALRLGTWQAVYLCEFDGPRTREIWLQFVPAAIGSRLEARG